MLAKLGHTPSPAQIQGNRLFAGIPAELVNEIGTHMALLRFDADDVIFHEGDIGDCFYLVVEGSVRISKSGRGGQQETLNFIEPENFFGEMSLIDGQPRSAQATAAQPTVLGQLDAQTFEGILENAPRALHMNFVHAGIDRLRGINAHFISELMRNERLALVGTMANSIIHDLKSPLSVIRCCTEMLAERVQDPAMTEFIGLMRRASNNLMSMTQELLDYARGQTSLQFERQAAGPLLVEVESFLRPTLPASVHLVHDVHVADDVNVDPGRFTRLLLNLAKNSIEAMPKGGVLWLGLRQEGDRVIFKIADTGCGIPPELLEKIFEPFVTFGKSKGTGLGLAIAKSVAEAHGGQIAVQSKVGLGTTIEVSLPALPVV